MLREDERHTEAFGEVVHYLCANPVRPGLVTKAEEWPYTGADVPGLPDLEPFDIRFSDIWWSYWNSLQ